MRPCSMRRILVPRIARLLLFYAPQWKSFTNADADSDDSCARFTAGFHNCIGDCVQFWRRTQQGRRGVVVAAPDD